MAPLEETSLQEASLLGKTIRHYAPQAWEQEPLQHVSYKKRRRKRSS